MKGNPFEEAQEFITILNYVQEFLMEIEDEVEQLQDRISFEKSRPKSFGNKLPCSQRWITNHGNFQS